MATNRSYGRSGRPAGLRNDASSIFCPAAPTLNCVLGYLVCSAYLLAPALAAYAEPDLSLTNEIVAPAVSYESQHDAIWESGVGEGFVTAVQSITVSAGATYGLAIFGGHQAHDLALTSFTYGHMLGHTLGENHWYHGNFEFRAELFTGAQFSPSSDWFVGLTPHLRYNIATGTRWIPFFDVGAGVTATSIGAPDLSGTFEFNLQAGGGVQWFLKDNLALSLEARYMHWSCAGIHTPNLGLNGITGLLGVSFFF